jgi:hypothetical protein
MLGKIVEKCEKSQSFRTGEIISLGAGRCYQCTHQLFPNCKILEIKYTICKMKNTQGLTANINNKR